MKRMALILMALIVPLGGVRAAPDECHVVLFGDSTVITGYLPGDQRIQAYLQAMLAKAYPGQKVRVSNVAQGGDYIGKFLLSGRYQREVLSRFDKIDIAVIRYGQNDWKHMYPAAYEKWLNQFYDTLEADYPGVVVIPEAGMFFYPKYMAGANRRAELYWKVVAAVARKRGYGFSDVYDAMRRETEAGNWDLRVRRDQTRDKSKDHLHKGERGWFSNGHPNGAGNLVAAKTEFAVIRKLFPKALPTANGRRKGDGKASVHTRRVVRPEVQTLYTSRGPAASDEKGRFVKVIDHPIYPRGTFQSTCKVKAPAGKKAGGTLTVIGEKRPSGRRYVLSPAQDGLQPAWVYVEAYAPHMREVKVEFAPGVEVRDLVVERLVWDRKFEDRVHRSHKRRREAAAKKKG